MAKRAALLCGVLGGVSGLLVAFFASSALNRLAGTLGWSNGGFYLAIVIAIALPVAAIAGGRMVHSNTIRAGLLLAISAVGSALIFGIDGLSFVPVSLSTIGAILAFSLTFVESE